MKKRKYQPTASRIISDRQSTRRNRPVHHPSEAGSNAPPESLIRTDIQDKGIYQMISFQAGYESNAVTCTLIFTDDDHTKWMLWSNSKSEKNWKLAQIEVAEIEAEIQKNDARLARYRDKAVLMS